MATVACLKLAGRAIVTRQTAAVLITNSRSFGDFPDPLEHATGIERKELLSKLAGDGRYEPKIFKRGVGTKEEPNVIPSHFDKRIVGCVCNPDQMHINWMWVLKGRPTRCECGYYFQVTEADPNSW